MWNPIHGVKASCMGFFFCVIFHICECSTNLSSIANAFSCFENVKLSILEKILVIANIDIYFGIVMCYNK